MKCNCAAEQGLSGFELYMYDFSEEPAARR